MVRLLLWVLVAVVVLVVGGVAYLMLGNAPPPVTRVERVVPNDRLAR